MSYLEGSQSFYIYYYLYKNNNLYLLHQPISVVTIIAQFLVHFGVQTEIQIHFRVVAVVAKYQYPKVFEKLLDIARLESFSFPTNEPLQFIETFVCECLF